MESNNHVTSPNNSNRKLIKWGIAIFCVLFATLPFHYIPTGFKVFAKDHLTFSNTFILPEDIDAMVNRYNDASIIEKLSISNEPLYKKLREKGIIYDADKGPIPNETQPAESNNLQDDKATVVSPPQQEQYSDADKKVIEKLKEKAKRDWPNDFSMQKIIFDAEVEAYFYMKTVTDLNIKKRVQRNYPLDYSIQKIMYNSEIDAKEQMK